MTQTIALFVDAYRELSAKRLFWLVLILSGLVVAAFAVLGISPQGVTIAKWTIGDFGGLVTSDTIPPDKFYKGLFSGFGIQFWLAWIASILALVSTAGMFPDFIAGGAIELTLSKPISRLRLFFTKYATGLLFVTLQVTVFSVASFLVIGFRGKTWEPAVFLAIPIVVVFFSYLFSMCVLLGLLTRSTIASLLLTLLAWLFLFCLNVSDQMILQGREINAMRVEALPRQIAGMERTAADQLRREFITEKVSEGLPRPDAEAQARGMTFPPDEMERVHPRLRDARESLRSAEAAAPKWDRAWRLFGMAKTVFPKTTETTDLLERVLIKDMDLEPPEDAEDDQVPSWMRLSRADQQRLATRMAAAYRQRSAWWVLGTSLGFEAVVLALGAWVFCRRDF
jgi:ABC-type transport system involved in multi-copper enzyme maturation permease subunit